MMNVGVTVKKIKDFAQVIINEISVHVIVNAIRQAKLMNI